MIPEGTGIISFPRVLAGLGFSPCPGVQDAALQPRGWVGAGVAPRSDGAASLLPAFLRICGTPATSPSISRRGDTNRLKTKGRMGLRCAESRDFYSVLFLCFVCSPQPAGASIEPTLCLYQWESVAQCWNTCFLMMIWPFLSSVSSSPSPSSSLWRAPGSCRPGLPPRPPPKVLGGWQQEGD